ncbi:MAG TPA: hypothetical protein DDW52_21550 [Planctomycetaceae bacterium]|nr:hypothetical protein [Planctomycetaceae bacterium]
MSGLKHVTRDASSRTMKEPVEPKFCPLTKFQSGFYDRQMQYKVHEKSRLLRRKFREPNNALFVLFADNYRKNASLRHFLGGQRVSTCVAILSTGKVDCGSASLMDLPKSARGDFGLDSGEVFQSS